MTPVGRLLLLLLPLVGCDDAATEESSSTPAPTTHQLADVTAGLGIDFQVRRPPRAGDYFMPDSMGPGCALFDADGDGRLDIYLVSGVRDAEGGLETDAGANRLFLQGADGKFDDATAGSGAGHRGYGMGVALGDIDNDGDLDIYLTNYGPDALLRNEGGGKFVDITEAAGLGCSLWGASAAFFDHDGDGFLDLFVTNYLDFAPAEQGIDSAGRPEYPPPSAFSGVPDLLYRNDGDGTFTDVSASTGIGGKAGAGLGVAIIDLDDDGRLDIYVANDGELNFAWIRQDDGTFVDDALTLGLAANVFGEAEAGMGVAVGDVDGDLDFDLLVTHLVQESHTLYRRDAGGSFTDATMQCGLSLPSTDPTGFGTAFVDIDNDGDLDLPCANGRVLRRMASDASDVGAHWNPYAERDQLFLNDGYGIFTTIPAGDFSARVAVSRGLAHGDFDDDGKVDLLISEANGTARLFHNRLSLPGNWLVVRAWDPVLGRDAIGAVVEIVAGGEKQRRRVTTTGGYLSAREPICHFGLGAADAVEVITVTWPDGVRETFPGGPADRRATLAKGSGQ